MAVAAQSPIEGEWDITYYQDRAYASQERICFKSVLYFNGLSWVDNRGGDWYSITTAEWKGTWYRKGDRFYWYGVTAEGIATAGFGQIINGQEIAGEFARFSEHTDISSSINGNWKAEKHKNACDF